MLRDLARMHQLYCAGHLIQAGVSAHVFDQPQWRFLCPSPTERPESAISLGAPDGAETSSISRTPSPSGVPDRFPATTTASNSRPLTEPISMTDNDGVEDVIESIAVVPGARYGFDLTKSGPGTALVQQLSRLREPVGNEGCIQLTDNRTRHACNELDVMDAFPDVAALVIGIFDEVLRAGKANHPIHHNDLAVVTQVQAIPLIIEWPGRQHLVRRRGAVGARRVRARPDARRLPR